MAYLPNDMICQLYVAFDLILLLLMIKTELQMLMIDVIIFVSSSSGINVMYGIILMIIIAVVTIWNPRRTLKYAGESCTNYRNDENFEIKMSGAIETIEAKETYVSTIPKYHIKPQI